MRYIGLCSGSKGNSWVIQSAQATIMIDCGSTKGYLLSKLEENQLGIDQVDALLITHTHKDHVSQIKMFEHVPVFTPTPSISGIGITPYESFQIQDLIITPIPLSHDCDITCGYVVQDQHEKLAYITDTGYISSENMKYIKNLDYYIIESNHDVEMLMDSKRPYYIKTRILGDSGHLCNEDCAQLLKAVIGKRTKEITLAHLSEEANTAQKALQVIGDELNHFDGMLQVALQKQCVEGGKL